ncbi:MAG: hypothetical protein M0P77_03360 [Firmicutes bacterium]|nr:hypothetical protein [Bacillota bacterium]
MDKKLKNIKGLMAKHETSFYVYFEGIIKRQIDILLDNFPQFEFLYSIKTNPFQPIVDYVVSKGLGADAASAKEVFISHEAGLPYEKILYSTPGKTRKDIERTIDKAIIIADSYNELILINSIAKNLNTNIKVGLRVNPDFNMDGEKGISSKFGVDESTLINHREFFKSLTNIKIAGLHIHIKSQVLDYMKLYQYYENIFKLAEYCKDKLNWDIDFINFGGGLGLVYSLTNDAPLDIKTLGYKCNDLIEKCKNKLKARFIIETGRFVICEAGYYVTPITDIKESMGTKYLIVEKGLNGFLRPSIAELLASNIPEMEIKKSIEPLYTVKDAFEFLIPEGDANIFEKVSIVGSLCTATDIMVKDLLVPKADIGDYIVVTKAGSYSYSLSPLLFAGHELPLQFYIKQD